MHRAWETRLSAIYTVLDGLDGLEPFYRCRRTPVHVNMLAMVPLIPYALM